MSARSQPGARHPRSSELNVERLAREPGADRRALLESKISDQLSPAVNARRGRLASNSKSATSRGAKRETRVDSTRFTGARVSLSGRLTHLLEKKKSQMSTRDTVDRCERKRVARGSSRMLTRRLSPTIDRRSPSIRSRPLCQARAGSDTP